MSEIRIMKNGKKRRMKRFQNRVGNSIGACMQSVDVGSAAVAAVDEQSVKTRKACNAMGNQSCFTKALPYRHRNWSDFSELSRVL